MIELCKDGTTLKDSPGVWPRKRERCNPKELTWGLAARRRERVRSCHASSLEVPWWLPSHLPQVPGVRCWTSRSPQSDLSPVRRIARRLCPELPPPQGHLPASLYLQDEEQRQSVSRCVLCFEKKNSPRAVLTSGSKSVNICQSLITQLHVCCQ